MSKTKTDNPAADPFRDAPRFNPFGPSPLDANAPAQSRARGVAVRSIEEQTRAANLPRAIDSGQAAPKYGDDVPSRPPFPSDSARQPGVPVERPRASDRRSK